MPEPEPVTTYVTIGNSDDGLSQEEWAEFYSSVDHHVRRHARTVFGAFVSEPTSPYQNACWAAEIHPEERALLMPALGAIAAAFRQHSIAWVEGPVHFIPATATYDGPTAVPS